MDLVETDHELHTGMTKIVKKSSKKNTINKKSNDTDELQNQYCVAWFLLH